MAADDWYRQSKWTAEGAALFEEKIGRARSQKSQYLMLQAYHLIDARPDVSLHLLDRAERAADPRYPDPRLGNFRAMAELRLGNIEKVIAAYKQSIAQQEADGGIFTSSLLDYAFTVACFGIEEEFQSALAALEPYPGGSPFPNSDAQAYAAMAMILSEQGNASEAAARAKQALAALQLPDRPLVDGDAIGGINPVQMIARLENIAAG